MCGPWGEYYCTGERWFTFMGSTDNGYTPFQIDYIFDANNTATFTPFNYTVIPCDQASNVSYREIHDMNLSHELDSCRFKFINFQQNESSACGCIDCQATCPPPPLLPPLPKHFELFGTDGLSIVMVLTFLLFASVFVTVYMCWKCRSQKNQGTNNIMTMRCYAASLQGVNITAE
ncbi:hypothetical protein SK128_027402 [Halocaridina rubra]|uniref:Niemann-Pick C1 N-terminal domain-containing protein n=1 Tax=Halocaridina rubra TaxID=373956 RepID=A0AAN8XLZ9_HALRR